MKFGMKRVKYKIIRTESFDEELNKLSKLEKIRIRLFENKISTNPYIGKPLGIVFFREKRLNGKRVYYLIYGDILAILMIAISDKKSQQSTINKIKLKLKEYSELIKKKLKGLSLFFHF